MAYVIFSKHDDDNYVDEEEDSFKRGTGTSSMNGSVYFDVQSFEAGKGWIHKYGKLVPSSAAAASMENSDNNRFVPCKNEVDNDCLDTHGHQN